MGMTAWAVVSGLALAGLVGLLPYWRSWIVIGVVAGMVIPWDGGAALARCRAQGSRLGQHHRAGAGV